MNDVNRLSQRTYTTLISCVMMCAALGRTSASISCERTNKRKRSANRYYCGYCCRVQALPLLL